MNEWMKEMNEWMKELTKAIKADCEQEFPGVKFSVRQTRSIDPSIDITYTEGAIPTDRQYDLTRIGMRYEDSVGFDLIVCAYQVPATK